MKRSILDMYCEPSSSAQANLFIAATWIVLVSCAIGFVIALILAPFITAALAIAAALLIVALVKLQALTAREQELDARDRLRQGSYSE